ncbi:metallophosphoesterase family protein [Paenibacillus xylanilyticus]|uniref:metallophosphoesterase family protein n=1 Tax=Paenibacillus xylanilyticus TaxID=248903 RepID=UPI0039A1974A
MKITKLNEEPIERFNYLNAIPGGDVAEAQLPIYHGTVSGLPEGVDALIVASDLQGIIPVPRENGHQKTTDMTTGTEPGMDRLLGEMLPAHVRLLLEVEWPEIDPGRVGVLLCGDLYARRGKRGASGNPVPVWLAFREAFGWVAGIDGNHDLTDVAGAHRLQSGEGIHYMDVPAVIGAGPPGGPVPRGAVQSQLLRIAGLGGIIGRPDKPNRLPEKHYLQSVNKLLKQQPDCLLLHQSPGIPEHGLMGEPLIRQALEAGPETVVFCGHTHWDTPLVQLKNGTQIVNADSKLFILTRYIS